jgi:hypothetical protein
MERQGATYDEATCSHEGKEYPLGYELCMSGTDCVICHNGNWQDRKIETFE